MKKVNLMKLFWTSLTPRRKNKMQISKLTLILVARRFLTPDLDPGRTNLTKNKDLTLLLGLKRQSEGQTGTLPDKKHPRPDKKD